MKLGTTARFTNKCKKSGARFVVTATYSWDPSRKSLTNGLCSDFWKAEDGREFASGSFGIVYKCECGFMHYAKIVRGKFNPGKKCDSRCTNASGHDCECSCGGKNHGSK